MRFLLRHSVWDPSAVDPEEFKYRNLKRFWLPLFDLVCMLFGFLAIVHGSTILNKLYPAGVVDVFGLIFMVASGVALVGVSFPALWLPEMLGKAVMTTLMGGYSITLWASFFHGEMASGFVAGMLFLPILFPIFRLQLLGEEMKQRRVDGESK